MTDGLLRFSALHKFVGQRVPSDWPRPWGDIVAHVASALSPPTAKYNDPFC